MASKHSAEFVSVVRGLTSSGEAVVELPEGLVCFVPGAWVGEKIRFHVQERKKRFARGRLVDVIEASAGRRTNPLKCQYHGFTSDSCGGCPWLFVEYDSQLKEKQRRIEGLLDRSLITHAEGALRPIQSSDLQWKYRTRAQLKSDGKSLGFVPARGRGIVDIESCPVLTDVNQESLIQLRSHLPESRWEPRRGRDWTTLDVSEDQAEKYLENKRSEFQQANRGQNKFMRSWLRETIEELGPFENVLELFCGAGNFTEIISEGAGVESVWAFEGASEAIRTLRGKSFSGVRAFEGDLFRESAPSWVKKKLNQTRVELLFLDPPRAGLKDMGRWLTVLPDLKAVVYVSCDSATFFRDAKALNETGFELQQLQPLDLFPQTPHCELLSVFVKKESSLTQS